MRTYCCGRTLVFTVGVVVVLSLAGLVAHAQDTARRIPYQGRLDMNGVPQNGSFDFILTIQDAGGASFWSETFSGVEVFEGKFSVILGQDTVNNPLVDSVWQNDELYLTIQVRAAGDPTFAQLSGRQRILSVPYAARAETAKNYHVTGQLDVGGKITTNDDLEVAGATQTGSLSVSSNATVGGNLSVSGRIIGPEMVTSSISGLGTVTASCPQGKRVIWAMGWTNDLHSPCNEQNRDNRCSKPIILIGCAGQSSCSYTGNSGGCSDAGYSCIYAMCE